MHFQEKWEEIWDVRQDASCVAATVNIFKRSLLESVFDLLNFPNVSAITSINVSACVSLDATSLVDLLPICSELNSFVFRYCSTFTEYLLIRLAENAPKLQYMDGKGACKVSYASGLAILSSLPSLSFINVQIREGETKYWQKLITVFSRVLFGGAIKDQLEFVRTIEYFIKTGHLKYVE